jgi:hypothetical protein
MHGLQHFPLNHIDSSRRVCRCDISRFNARIHIGHDRSSHSLDFGRSLERCASLRSAHPTRARTRVGHLAASGSPSKLSHSQSDVPRQRGWVGRERKIIVSDPIVLSVSICGYTSVMAVPPNRLFCGKSTIDSPNGRAYFPAYTSKLPYKLAVYMADLMSTSRRLRHRLQCRLK